VSGRSTVTDGGGPTVNTRPPVQAESCLVALAPVDEVTVSQGHADTQLAVDDLDWVKIEVLDLQTAHATDVGRWNGNKRRKLNE